MDAFYLEGFYRCKCKQRVWSDTQPPLKCEDCGGYIPIVEWSSTMTANPAWRPYASGHIKPFEVDKEHKD